MSMYLSVADPGLGYAAAGVAAELVASAGARAGAALVRRVRAVRVPVAHPHRRHARARAAHELQHEVDLVEYVAPPRRVADPTLRTCSGGQVRRGQSRSSGAPAQSGTPSQRACAEMQRAATPADALPGHFHCDDRHVNCANEHSIKNIGYTVHTCIML